MVSEIIFIVGLVFIYYHIVLYIFIIIDRAVGAPVHGKNIFNGMNNRDKHIFRVTMANILNPALICNCPNFQVHSGSLK